MFKGDHVVPWLQPFLLCAKHLLQYFVLSFPSQSQSQPFTPWLRGRSESGQVIREIVVSWLVFYRPGILNVCLAAHLNNIFSFTSYCLCFWFQPFVLIGLIPHSSSPTNLAQERCLHTAGPCYHI